MAWRIAFTIVGADKEAVWRLRINQMHEVGHLVIHKWVIPSDLQHELKQNEDHRLSSVFLLSRNICTGSNVYIS